MNGIRKLSGLALAALAASALLGQALAAPVVSINPTTQDVAIGGSASVAIVVSGLTLPGEAIGGFAITLDFNGALLSGSTYAVDPAAKMGTYDLDNDFSSDFSGGSLDLFYLADALLDETALATLQTGGTFTLATVSFQGLAAGLSPLTLSAVDLSYSDGITTIPNVGTRNGSICVGGDCATVPEPATYALVGIALAGMLAPGALRRRRQAATAA